MPTILARLAIITVAAGVIAAGEAALPTPEAFLKDVISKPQLRSATGEQYTWFAAYYAHDFLSAFEATRDPAWLEAAQTYYDAYLKDGVSNDPDGWPGTIGADIGTTIDTETTVADTVVGDANLALPLMHFAELVRADPALTARFGKRADAYIALATRMCWEKWNQRGCYHEDSLGYGSYHTYGKAIDKADRSKWVPRTGIVSDNLNKHYKMGLVFLRLWRLTGKPEYRDRVVAIYSRAKAMFRYLPDEDRIVWNFWMPHGAYDIEGTSPKSWVGVHPSRPGYQAFEAGAFLQVYDAGLVFEQSDIERIVRTNVWMIEHGLQSADGSSKAGTVWSDLACLDPRILAATRGGKQTPIAAAHLAWQLGQRHGYERLDAPKALVLTKAPLQPGRRIAAALAVPEQVELANDDRIRLLAQVREDGLLRIELLSADGTEVLGELAHEDMALAKGSYAAPRWDGTNPKTGRKEPGRFLVRWTLNGESRTWPVTVIQGTARARSDAPAPLAAGGRLAYDFEAATDARWELIGGAAIAGDRHAQGAQALRIAFRQSATLRFGGEDDLPVRITFAAWDGGEKHGKKSDLGIALCLRTGDGNLFAMRQCWRLYLGGDGDWVWMNNGENQWFNPHPAGIGRSDGWNRWTFDFTDPAAVVIERDGKRLEAKRLQPERFVPAKGGVGLAFMGPATASAEPLWIDDLVVEYPAK